MTFDVFSNILLTEFPKLSDRQLIAFRDMEALYKEWNEKINVISRKDIDSLYLHHVLHSLSIAGYIKERLPDTWDIFSSRGTKVLDLGTGGGFPGIPLAILFPETEFILCDSIGKKIKVASAIADALSLDNVKTVNTRAESLPYKFEYIVSRAVTSLVNFYPWVKGKFSKDIFYLKGGNVKEEITELSKKHKMPYSDIGVWEIRTWLDDEYFNEKFVIKIPAK